MLKGLMPSNFWIMNTISPSVHILLPCFFSGCMPMRGTICLTKRTRRPGQGAESGVVVSFCTHFRWLVKGFSCILHPARCCFCSCRCSSSLSPSPSLFSVAACHLAPMGHPSPIFLLWSAGRKCFIYVWTTTTTLAAAAKFYLNMRGWGLGNQVCTSPLHPAFTVPLPSPDMCDFSLWLSGAVRSQIRKIDFPIDTFLSFAPFAFFCILFWHVWWFQAWLIRF